MKLHRFCAESYPIYKSCRPGYNQDRMRGGAFTWKKSSTNSEGSKLTTVSELKSNEAMKQVIERWKQQAKQLKVEIYAIYLAYKDPRVPLYARIFAACVVGYAFSPIDLIPDPIPILGYLDDLILIPLGITLVLKMIPPEVLAECRDEAQEIIRQGKPVNRIAAAVIIGIWFFLAALVIVFMIKKI